MMSVTVVEVNEIIHNKLNVKFIRWENFTSRYDDIMTRWNSDRGEKDEAGLHSVIVTKVFKVFFFFFYVLKYYF